MRLCYKKIHFKLYYSHILEITCIFVHYSLFWWDDSHFEAHGLLVTYTCHGLLHIAVCYIWWLYTQSDEWIWWHIRLCDVGMNYEWSKSATIICSLSLSISDSSCLHSFLHSKSVSISVLPLPNFFCGSSKHIWTQGQIEVAGAIYI